LAQGVAELLRRHGHSGGPKVPAAVHQGKLPQASPEPALSPRANCPTFSARGPVGRWKCPGSRCARRSACSRSSTTSCASWAPAPCRATTRCVRWPRRGAECGSLWPHSGPAPMRFAHGLGFVAGFGSVGRWGESLSGLLVWPSAPLGSWCGRCGGRCGRSCGWFTWYAGSGRSLPSERRRERGARLARTGRREARRLSERSSGR
jgi:hypothetical protein